MSSTSMFSRDHAMAGNIPGTQKAAVKQGDGYDSTAPVREVYVDKPGPGQILVKINWTGVCSSDMSFIYDEWASLNIRMQPTAKGIAGHEGAGVVVSVAEDVRDLWSPGDRAGVKWVAATCRKCEFCMNGIDEVHCLKQKNSGWTCPGTFQEYVVTDARYATRLPDGVSDEEAGPIMCGGVTAYVACKRSKVTAGQWLVILGAGGGLGHLAVQYASAMGMRVIAVDGGAEKEWACRELGAEVYLNYHQEDNLEAAVRNSTMYGSHGVIVFAASPASYAVAPMMLRPGGTEVVVGFPSDSSVIAGAPPVVIAMRKLNIVGSVTGTLKEVDEALDFVARGIVKPRLTKGKLSDLDEVLHKMRQGNIVGRAVLKVADD